MRFSEADDNSNYYCRRLSDTGIWEMGLIHRTFGRVAVGFSPVGALGPTITYCCGGDLDLVREVMWIVHIVLSSYPEDTPETEIARIFPMWNARPIDQDDCIEKLRILALQHIEKIGPPAFRETVRAAIYTLERLQSNPDQILPGPLAVSSGVIREGEISWQKL